MRPDKLKSGIFDFFRKKNKFDHFYLNIYECTITSLTLFNEAGVILKSIGALIAFSAKSL